MRVFYNLDALPKFKNAVITIGTFDGVHAGHQKILNQLKQEANNIGGETVIVTFYPHPRKIVHLEQAPFYLLNTLEEKLGLLNDAGMDNVIVVPFNETFASQSAEAYVEDFLVKKIRPKLIIIGYDHHFGKNRTGNFQTLERYGKQFNFDVKEIPEKVLNEIIISSTKIRYALSNGQVEEANTFLGYPYFLQGEVVKGRQLGRTIGYPTANIKIVDADKLIPKIGVYVVKIYDAEQKILSGMLSIGTNPTVGGTNLSIEVNIFDFDRDIYGSILKVYILAYLRDEEKYDSLESLTQQLALDKINALEVLKMYTTI